MVLCIDESTSKGSPQYWGRTAKAQSPPLEYLTHLGRSRTVEITSLEDAINDVLSLGIATHVKKFIFAPKHYVAAFWNKYREWLDELYPDDESFYASSNEWDSDIEGHSDDVDFDEDTHAIRARHRKRQEGRQKVKEAETEWAAKAEEQLSKAKPNQHALAQMFRSMPFLQAIEISSWSFNVDDYLLENDGSNDVSQQFARCETVAMHLNTLSSALSSSENHIKRLSLQEIDPPSIKTNGPLESMFSSLTALSFTVRDVDFMRLHSPRPVSGLIKLLTCASQTLENLTVQGKQYEGEKDLNRLFAESSDDATVETTTLVFPKMKNLKLVRFILHTPSLIAFLSQQPALRHADFAEIYLATSEYKWSDVARAMPASCTGFHVENCGHQLTSSSDPVTTHNMNDFFPFRKKEAFGADVGWRANKTLFKEEHMDVKCLGYRASWASTNPFSRDEIERIPKTRSPRLALIERVSVNA